MAENENYVDPAEIADEELQHMGKGDEGEE